MSILIGKEKRVLVQGITGKEGSFHTKQCVAYGTNVVAGVTPGKGGQDMDGVPVFNTEVQAVKETGADTSLIFVPSAFAADAIMESAAAGVGLVVCITEGIPVHDMLKVVTFLKKKNCDRTIILLAKAYPDIATVLLAPSIVISTAATVNLNQDSTPWCNATIFLCLAAFCMPLKKPLHP